MGSNIPLPALSIRPPEQPNVAQQYGQMLSLKSLLGQQQLQQGQIQLQQQQLKDQQALTQAFKNWNPQSQSYEDLAKAVTNLGGSGNAALQIQQHAFQVRETASKIAQNDAETGSKNLDTIVKRHDQILGALDAAKQVPDDQLGQHITDTVAQLQREGILTDPSIAQNAAKVAQLPPDQARPELERFEKSLIGQKQQFENAKTQADTAGVQASTAKTQAETKFYSNLGLAPGVTPDMAAYAAYLQKGGKPEGWTAYKAQQEAAATQPYKIQTAQVEAQARMALEGMAKPVYAFNPQTNQKDLMNQTEAIAQGRKVMTPVTAKEVSDDTMLINRLSDVQQKIARYEQTLQQPLSPGEKTVMSAVLNEGGLKLGAAEAGIGLQLPTDWLNKLTNAASKGHLSQASQDRLISYFNAREAMTGYNRVLTGSGRSSEKNLELQLETLPSPLDPEGYSRRSIGQFRENLKIVGQGLPNIPGVKTPEQWEQQITQPSGPQQQPQGPPINFQMPQPMNLFSLIGSGR